MKKTNFIKWIILFNSIALFSHAQKTEKEGDGLKITGAALLNDHRVSNYAVSVYLDGTKIDSMFVKSKRTIKFYVTYNEVYTFLFQKENCLDKIVIVNTQIPEGLKSMEDNTFDFEVEMSQSLAINSSEVTDYPVAVLLINKGEEVLEASAEYHKLTHADPDGIKNDAFEKTNGKLK